ncbi:MAG: FMN-binding protein [Oscillospiraceae bacterium]|jgi:electron transport complex protein RnfG|nr:FMN-binding protein [Oscillospiraceae bacterium]
MKRNAGAVLLPALSLLLICAAVAGILAVVNTVTKEPIAKSAKQAVEVSMREIFPSATEFLSNKTGRVYTARSAAGQPLGYCVESDAQGYAGLIKIMVGISPKGQVLQVKVLDCASETPGLGQKVQEPKWLAQFAGQTKIESIDSVASATYSSKGVMHAVNAALAIYEEDVQ